MKNRIEANRVAELRRMPEAEWERILEKAAASMVDVYATDPELKALEDYGDIIEEAS